MHTQLAAFTHSGVSPDDELVARAATAARLVLGLAQHPAWWTPDQALLAHAVGDTLTLEADAAALRHAEPDPARPGPDADVVYLRTRRSARPASRSRSRR